MVFLEIRPWEPLRGRFLFFPSRRNAHLGDPTCAFLSLTGRRRGGNAGFLVTFAIWSLVVRLRGLQNQIPHGKPCSKIGVEIRPLGTPFVAVFCPCFRHDTPPFAKPHVRLLQHLPGDAGSPCRTHGKNARPHVTIAFVAVLGRVFVECVLVFSLSGACPTSDPAQKTIPKN